MGLEIPKTAIEVENLAQADVQRILPLSNPRLKNSWLLALVTSFSNRIFDFYADLTEVIKQNFPDTATDPDFVEQWAAIFGKQRKAASASAGNCIASGTVSSVIPIGTSLSAEGNFYTTTSSGTIAANSIGVISPDGIVRSGQTATVTTISDHNLADNILVTISGAIETEYNVVDTDIIVTGLNTFQYTIAGTPATPATGTILISFDSASVTIQSDDFGVAQNLDSGTALQLQSPIAGVDDALFVDFGKIGGGSEQETDQELKDRYLFKLQNPVSHFNDSDIIDAALEIEGVTRVFVEGAGKQIGTAAVTSINRSGTVATVILTNPQDLNTGQLVTITGANEPEYNLVDAPILVESTTLFHYVIVGTPAPATGTILSSLAISLGALQVYFMRDNDDNPIPSGSEILKVREKILEILPANTDEDSDLGVFAPTPVSVDYSFSELTPNTVTMQDAIVENLKVFFSEETFVNIDVDQDAYRAAIFNTVDPQTGDVVLTFDLSTPTTDVTISVGSIGILGNVSF